MQTSLPFKQHVKFATTCLVLCEKARQAGQACEAFGAIAAVHMHKAHEQVREARGMGAMASLAISRIKAAEHSHARLSITEAQMLGRVPCTDVQKLYCAFDSVTAYVRLTCPEAKTILAYVDGRYVMTYDGAPYWVWAEAGNTYTKLQRVGHE
jgi:hypothetical protein